MPRTLPWLKKRPSPAGLRKNNGNIAPRPKRPKPLDISDVELERSLTPNHGKLSFGRMLSSLNIWFLSKSIQNANLPRRLLLMLQVKGSVPFEHILLSIPLTGDSFMHDGLDHDDRYRMVEDEFLETAKLFTTHLHAAEYRRLKEAARKQNADTISSISRPVTQRMSDSTKRKVEGVSRAKKQTKIVSSLLGKAGADEGDSDDEGSAWIGTALHGLMDSTQKSASNLIRIGSISSSTKASAGFGKRKQLEAASNLPRHAIRESARRFPDRTDPRASQDDSSDDNDDLDGSAYTNVVVKTASMPKSSTVKTGSRSSAAGSSGSIQATSHRYMDGTKSSARSMGRNYVTQESISETSEASLPSLISVRLEASEAFVSQSPDSAARIKRRLEQAGSLRVKKEDDTKSQERLDIIPTFL